MKLVEKLNDLFKGVAKICTSSKFKSDSDNKSRSETNLERANDLILEELESVHNQLECANMVFNSQTNFDLIESTIYHIDSLEKKYSYLLKEARKRQLRGVF